MDKNIATLINQIRNNKTLLIHTKDTAICYITWMNNKGKIDKNKSKQLIKSIFRWSKTPQGLLFWYEINNALLADSNYRNDD